MAACDSNPSDTPTIWQEQAFLETYFQCLSKFAYDKAKEITDREREETKAQSTLLWSSLLSLLTTLSASEKSFYSLLFLSNNFPWIKRKDTLRTTYSCLLTELKKIDKAHSVVLSSGERTLEVVIGRLCNQLQDFVTARIKIIGFYEQMDTLGQSRIVTCEEIEDLLGVVNEISSVCQNALKHPILNPLMSSFSLECECISRLLQAQRNIQLCQYMRALLNLFTAHTKLNIWQSLIVAKDSKKLGFVSSSKTWSPALHEWMCHYKNALVSKFSLYFHDVLCRQSSLSEVKALTSKLTVDFHAKMCSFQKRSDAVNMSLIFNAGNREDQEQFAGLGYHLTLPTAAADGGHGGYYAILSCPSELMDYDWLRVYHVLQQKRQELDTLTDKPVYRCDEGRHGTATYFLIRTDPLVTLLIVYNCKKMERDSHITHFMTNIASELRCTKLFATLRPGHK